MSIKLTSEETAIRAHDIVVSMERARATEYESVQALGLAVRLALHLRGVPPIEYELVKKVAVYLLGFGVAEVKPVLELLAEAEFVSLATEGTTIKMVVPQVPFFDDLYTNIGEVALARGLTEVEQLTMHLAHTLAKSPIIRDAVFNLGAERKAVDDVLRIGTDAQFILTRRSRGRDVLVSPSYFAENDQGAYADLVAAEGAGRVKRVLELLRSCQGWPLALLEKNREVSGSKLDDQDMAIVRALAGDGFVRPPAIETSHHGTNHFLFGPRPGAARLPLNKKRVYEAAMALVAAVRQGQLLPAQFAIKYPSAILRKLKDRGFIGANSEAPEQYHQVAQLQVGRLVPSGGDMYRFELNRERPENIEAVDLALELISTSDVQAKPEEEIILALRQGQTYVDSLIGRKKLIPNEAVPPDPEEIRSLQAALYYGGRS